MRYPLGDAWLIVECRGMTGAFGLACALDMRVIPAVLSRALERGEWLDILAKARGMDHCGLLYRWPVVRRDCGCRVAFDVAADPSEPTTIAHLVVRLCPAHPWAMPELDARDRELSRLTMPDARTIRLGRLVARD